jgi:hypothetical protein
MVVMVAILLVVLRFTVGQAKSTHPSPAPSEDALLLDPDWVKSVQEKRTTPMEPYDHLKPNCSLGNYEQPHVTLQCECQQKITLLAEDIANLYEELKQVMMPKIYPPDGLQNLNITSCDPKNQALLWLASGNTRASSDLLDELYVRALAAVIITENAARQRLAQLTVYR